MATVNHSDNLESSSAIESNSKTEEQKSKRNFDIFVKRPGKKDNNNVTSLEKCHGFLKLTFCASLLLIVFFTALTSRVAFHIILINLNPPTIFTTINKFGGDNVNKTLAFEPAQVHLSWMWACFLVLVTPSVHSFVYHAGQLCRKKYQEVDDTDNENMHFLIQSIDNGRANISEILKRKWKVFETGAETCKKIHFKINGCVQWIIIIALGFGQTVCETIVVFVVLPNYDQVTACLIAVLMTIFAPSIFNGLINPYFRFQKFFVYKKGMCIFFRVFSCLLLLSIFSLLAAYMMAMHKYANPASHKYAFGFPFAITVCLCSLGSWENLSGFYIEKLNKRTTKMMILSLVKMFTHFGTFLTIVGIMGGCEGISVLFNCLPSAKLTMLDKSILLVNEFPLGVNCSLYHPFCIAIFSLVASYACYKFSYYACRTYLQIFGFTLPLMLNILLVPIIIWCTFKPDSSLSKFEDCSIISNAWDFSVNQGDNTYKGIIISCGCLTFVCLFLLTTYTWNHGLRIAKLEKLFAMPFYAGYAVDITLLWSRRRLTKIRLDNKNDTKEKRSSLIDQRKEEHPQNTHDSPQDINNEEDRNSKGDFDTMVPFIYLCATMWHETELEMRTILRSIFRLNNHQLKTTCLQKLLMHENKISQPEESYFQFEAHIFFDDAFKENKEKVKAVNSKSNKTEWKRYPGKEVNDFVKQFIRCAEDISRSYYNVEDLNKNMNKFKTPYGARLEWNLESPPKDNVQEIFDCLNAPCRLILHLKDKFLVRNKKRWSQVMYMYYLLSYIPNVKYQNDSEQTKQQESRLQYQDDSQDDTQNQDDSQDNTHWQNQNGSQTSLESSILKKFETKISPKTFILALDGDVDFQPDAVLRLLERMLKSEEVGAACGRIIPMGRGPVVWYQKFEYAVSHWLQKATEHVYGCVLCSPGCFSLFRASALMSDDVIKIYTSNPSNALECIQFDQGEDRWLSTLLLKQGFKLEYTAASDAYTYVPEGFFEFFNQRRRWSPSTLANIFEIISNISLVSKANNFISKLYLLYHMFLFVSSFITPGTIFLMILGATNLAFPEIPVWVAFLINITLVGVVMVSCVLADQERQLTIISVISSIYALMMIVVLFGLILDAIRSDFCSVTTYFFFYVAGIFLLAAVLHPREFTNIIYGAVYFLAVPTTSMLMLIYALGNLHVTSWGTRESNNVKKAKNQRVEDSDDACSCFGLFRCTCMPRAIVKKQMNKEKSQPKKKVNKEKKKCDKKKDKKNKKKANRKQSVATEDKSIPPNTRDVGGSSVIEAKNSEYSDVTRPEDLRDAKNVEITEQGFWDNIIRLYLNPNVKEDKNLIKELRSLRNRVYAGFIMINLIYMTLVFVITQTNELNNDVFTIELPCPNQTKTFAVDPISVIFSVTFGFVLFFQLLGMLIHRYSTFAHIVSISQITWICKHLHKKDSDEKTKKNQA